MKRVLVLLLTAVVMFAFAGCGSEVTDDAQNEATKESATYQDIFDEYSEQIKTATPKLVDEYNKGNIQPCFKWYEVMPFMIMIIVFGIVILKIFLIKEPENDFVHI